MITQEQFDKVAASKAVTNYETRMKTFKDYLEVNGLTFQSDYNKIELEFKTKLFGELMKVDKGLAYEWNNLLKSPEAKMNKINSKIDLHGYEVPMFVKGFIKELEQLHKHVFTSFSDYGYISMEDLINSYDGVATNYIRLSVIDWTGLEDYKKLFETFEKSLSDLIPVYRSSGKHSVSTVFELFSNIQKDITTVYGKNQNGSDVMTEVKMNPVYLYSLIKHLRKK